jgi:hypothetical protein
MSQGFLTLQESTQRMINEIDRILLQDEEKENSQSSFENTTSHLTWRLEHMEQQPVSRSIRHCSPLREQCEQGTGISSEKRASPMERARRASEKSALRLREPLTMVSRNEEHEEQIEGAARPLYPPQETGVSADRRDYGSQGGTQCYGLWSQEEIWDVLLEDAEANTGGAL